MKRLAWVTALLVVSGCFDFDADLEKCKSTGKCVDAPDASATGGGSGGGGGGVTGGGTGGAFVNRVSLSAPSFDFGDVARDDSARSGTLTASIVGDAGSFGFVLDSAAINAGFTVAPGCNGPAATCDFTVGLRSLNMAGAVSGSLFVDGGEAGGATLQLAAQLVERFGVSSTTVDFGATSTAVPVTRQVQLTHSANSPTSLTYMNSQHFTVLDGGCPSLTTPNCVFDVRFSPTVAMPVSETLTITNPTTSYSVTIQLTAQALPPSDVVFAPATLHFGVVDAGTRVTQGFTARNHGGVNAAFAFAFATDAGFGIDAGTCASAMLAPDASCDGVVDFIPSGPGTRTATLTFDVGSTLAILNADGVGRVTWDLSLRSDGGTITESTSAPCSNCNATFEETVAPVNASLSAAPLDVFWGNGTWSGDCSGPTSSSCSVSMNQNRSALANFDRVREPVTLTTVGTGNGTISGGTSAFPCGANCFAHAAGSMLVLTATPARGSIFGGWSGGAASCGTNPTCMVTVGTSGLNASATFLAINYAFVTRENFDALAVAQGDTHCAHIAADAGLPGTYLAFLFQSDGGAFNRFNGSRGWLRTDEQPFIDTLDGGTNLTAPVVFYPLLLDARGQPISTIGNAWTGEVGSGALANCSNWTSTSGAAGTGNPAATSQSWLIAPPMYASDCGQTHRLYCLGRGANTAVRPPPPPASSVLIFVSSSITNANNDGGICTVDAADAGLLTAGRQAAPVRAMFFSSPLQSSAFDTAPPRPVFRTDGVKLYDSNAFVLDGGTADPPRAGFNATARGQLFPWSAANSAWLGATGFNQPGLFDSCGEWSSSLAGDPGSYFVSDRAGAPEVYSTTCNDTHRFVCVVR